VGAIAHGLGGQRREQVADLVAGDRDPLGRWWVAGVLGQGGDDQGQGIKVRIARCGIESSTRLGCHRWKADRAIAWLAGCRRLPVRYHRDAERFFAFAMLAGDRLCYNRLPRAATARLP
jgi:hypothetical protein